MDNDGKSTASMPINVKEIKVHAVVKKADGTIIDYGVVSSSKWYKDVYYKIKTKLLNIFRK